MSDSAVELAGQDRREAVPGGLGVVLASVLGLPPDWGARVRAALADVRSGAQTPLESISRVRLMRCGLPEPRLQVPFHDDSGLIGIVDMYFDELGVIGEADGLLKYRTGEDLISEKRREDRLRRIRPVVRWEWSEIWSNPSAVARRIHEAARSRQ